MIPGTSYLETAGQKLYIESGLMKFRTNRQRDGLMVRLLIFALLCFLLALFPPALAQQVDCTIKVDYEAVATAQKDLLRNFERDIREYVHNQKWGPDDLDEKVKFVLSVFIKGATGDNRYAAQVFVGSQRPILGSEEGTAVVRLFDDSWEFTYLEHRPINQNLYSFDDLASFLDFYVFLVLGFDYDTYEPRGGTPFFQKAADVANLGRGSGSKGWEQKSGSFSRVQLIDEILNPKFAPVRNAIYAYHFSGLDSLAIDRNRALNNILSALETVGTTRKRVDPRNMYIKAFFDAKYLEVANLFLQYPDREVYSRLSKIDPSHQTTYEEYFAKRR